MALKTIVVLVVTIALVVIVLLFIWSLKNALII